MSAIAWMAAQHRIQPWTARSEATPARIPLNALRLVDVVNARGPLTVAQLCEEMGLSAPRIKDLIGHARRNGMVRTTGGESMGGRDGRAPMVVHAMEGGR